MSFSATGSRSVNGLLSSISLLPASDTGVVKITNGVASLIPSVGLTVTPVKSSNYTAEPYDLIRADTSQASFNITFPSFPVDGTQIGILDISKTFGANSVTLVPGVGDSIEDDSVGMLLDIPGSFATFLYSASTTNWNLLNLPISSGSSLQVSPIRTSDYTAEPGELVRVNTTQNTINVTLPNLPTDGSTIGIIDMMSTFSVNPVTVIPSSGYTIENESSIILDINHAYVEFVFSLQTMNWLIKSTPVSSNTIVNMVLDDISNRFDGITNVFALTANGVALNTILDSKDLDVFINGLKVNPYIDQLRLPWLTPYDSFNGFKVVNNQLILYKAPFTSNTASLTYKSSSSTRQSQRYPFNAITIALGD